MHSVVEDLSGRAKKGPKAGGKATAEAKRASANEWHAECVTRARALLTQGKSPREIAGILSVQFRRSARQVREVLKKAEVK